MIIRRGGLRFMAVPRCHLSNHSGSHADAGNSIETVEEEMMQDTLWAQTLKAEKKKIPLYVPTSSEPSALRCNDIEEYMRRRGFSGWDSSPPATRMLTSLLTYPLTLAHGIETIYGSKRPNLNVLLLGARSESSLPLKWWAECLHACSSSNINITMLGPGLQITNNLEILLDFPNSETKKLRIANLKKNYCRFHDHLESVKMIQSNDLFVLFNPGIGSDSQKQFWQPTIELLLESKKPLLLSAHGRYDLNRDVSAVRNLADLNDNQCLGEPLEFLIMPKLNPFRSSRRVIDKNEVPEATVVTTNHYVYAIQAK
jgi:hypothetical protein